MEDDGLQTDVMRFMAIIAFCLVAVLALVRDAQPAPEAASTAAPAPPPPSEEPTVTEAAPVASVAEADPKPRRLPAPELRPVVQSEPAAEEAKPPETIFNPTPPPAVAETPLPTLKRAPFKQAPLKRAPDDIAQRSPTDAEDPDPLTLRFASDSAFLHLIRTGGVRVYAWHNDAAYVLDRGFTFRAADAPATVHELATVPRRVALAFPETHEKVRWGVRLPPEVSRSVRDLAQQYTTGQLVIGRGQEVKHVPSA